MGATSGEIGLYGAEKLWDMLVFVEQHGAFAARQITSWVGVCGASLTGIIEPEHDAITLGDDLLTCEALADRPRPAEHDDRLLIEQLVEPILHAPRENCLGSHRFNRLLSTR
jgi:hypothetical protein